MIGKLPSQHQRSLFEPLLTDFISKKHELYLLAEKIDWKSIESSFEKFYSKTGKPSMPIRFMASCLILKRVYNLGDETLAEAWIMNPYMQYFSGMCNFTHKFPCDPSDFVHFRKRIGEEGINELFKHSVSIHGKQAYSKSALQDTTVQENNITYPTDSKLAKKVIEKCNVIAKSEGVTQRQTYTRTSKQLLRDSYNATHPKRAKKARAAQRKLRTLAKRQIRELHRKLDERQLEEYRDTLAIFLKAVSQQRKDKDKVYSLHKPFSTCIAKGKAHKKYEYGNKVGLMKHPELHIIQAITSYDGNTHDSKTIAPLLDQANTNFNYQPKEVIYDRGGRGKKNINGTEILTPTKPKTTDSRYKKSKLRKKFRKRAGIEPVIGHLKKELRMFNYLSGESSPKVNAMLAATGWNFKLMMKNLKNGFSASFFQALKTHILSEIKIIEVYLGKNQSILSLKVSS